MSTKCIICGREKEETAVVHGGGWISICFPCKHCHPKRYEEAMLKHNKEKGNKYLKTDGPNGHMT